MSLDSINPALKAGLDYIERRGTLTYITGFESRTMVGNFQLSLDRRTVEARKIRGRNRWQLCSTWNVVSFEVTR
jgi:hypothetical protein